MGAYLISQPFGIQNEIQLKSFCIFQNKSYEIAVVYVVTRFRMHSKSTDCIGAAVCSSAESTQVLNRNMPALALAVAAALNLSFTDQNKPKSYMLYLAPGRIT